MIIRFNERYRHWFFVEFYDNAKFIGRVGFPKGDMTKGFEGNIYNNGEVHIRNLSVVTKARRIV